MPQRLSQHIEQFLTLEGFSIDKIDTPTTPDDHSASEKDTTFRLNIAGKHAEWACFVRCFETSERLLVYSLLPDNIDTALKPRISELLCRINYGLMLGNFEMDWRDGELRYKTSFDTEGTVVNQTLIRNLIYANFHSFDLYFPAIQRAINTTDDLALIVQQTENPEAPTGFELVDNIVH